MAIILLFVPQPNGNPIHALSKAYGRGSVCHDFAVHASAESHPNQST